MSSSAEKPRKKLKLSMSMYIRPPLVCFAADIKSDTFTTLPLKIVVGEQPAKDFYITKDLICKHSEFFRAACNERWESGRTNTITLDEENPEIFALFLTWVTTGKFEESAEYAKIPNDRVQQNKQQVSQLCKCYILGDFLGSEAFCNAVMDMILDLSYRTHELSKNTWSSTDTNSASTSIVVGTSTENIGYVFSHTAPDSKLRQILLDNHFNHASVDDPQMDISEPGVADFYVQLASIGIKFRRRLSTVPPVWKRDFCDFHHHRDQPAGYVCRTGRGRKLKLNKR